MSQKVDSKADYQTKSGIATPLRAELESLREAVAAAKSSGEMWEFDCKQIAKELGVTITDESVDSFADECIEKIRTLRVEMVGWRPMTTASCVGQLKRSERGRMTITLLRDFLKSPTVQGLDGCNSEAVTGLVARHMLGNGTDACEVMDALRREDGR